MLKVRRAANEHVVLTLSGRVDAESIAELEALIEAEPNRSVIVLDLKDLTLVSQDGVIFSNAAKLAASLLRIAPRTSASGSIVNDWEVRQRKE